MTSAIGMDGMSPEERALVEKHRMFPSGSDEALAIGKQIHEAGLVYHYTTYQAFDKIVESRRLWATHIGYLNDSSEYSYAVEMLRSIAIERIDSASPAQRPALERLLQYGLGRIQPSVFTASFTRNGNLLSQ